MNTKIQNQKKILVIEDDELLGEIITAKLINANYTVLWRRDGKSAIATMLDFKPDLILLDIVLPIVSGYEILEQIHKDPELQNIPIIIISNSKQPVEVARSLKLGIKDYLVKANLSPEEVITRVNACLTEKTQSEKNFIEKPLSIIIVEDDTFLTELLSINFSNTNHLRFAQNGKVALKLLAEEKPEVIMLDIALPGMDGFAILEQIRSDKSNDGIAVIMLTNFGQDNDKQKALSLGADEYLVKANVDIDTIIREAHEIVRRKRGADK
jgi:DNA-binding response OmpR family regulator